MAKVVLYAALTLDGYIARSNGALDWLTGIDNPNQEDHGYKQLLSTTSAIIMGRKTYEEVLGFEIEWPYAAYETYILTHSNDFCVTTPNTYVLSGDLADAIQEISSRHSGNIWLVGGGVTTQSFLDKDMIDSIILSVIPIILGEGIPLFPGNSKESHWKVVQTITYSTGIIGIELTRKNQEKDW